jgi:thioester reductase-like protein
VCFSQKQQLSSTAWKVNFVHILSFFDTQILDVRNFLDFGFASNHGAPLLFMSSISAVSVWKFQHPEQALPERIMYESSAPGTLGYGESEYVSQRLLDVFSCSSGITSAVLRTDQVAGLLTVKGFWPKRE